MRRSTMPLFPSGLKFGGEKYIMFVCYLTVYGNEHQDIPNMEWCFLKLSSFFSQYDDCFSVYWSRSVPIIITHSGGFFPRHVFNICFLKNSDSKTTMKVHMSMVNCLSYSFLVLNAVSGVYNSRQKSLFLLWRPPFFDFDAKKPWQSIWMPAAMILFSKIWIISPAPR